MGYSSGGIWLKKGEEHAYTHFCKVKWHYIKSSISICGLLPSSHVCVCVCVAGWVRQQTQGWAAFYFESIRWSLEPPTEKKQKVSLFMWDTCIYQHEMLFLYIKYIFTSNDNNKMTSFCVNPLDVKQHAMLSNLNWRGTQMDRCGRQTFHPKS